MRTLVDIPDDVVAHLDALARQNKRSRAAEVRDALSHHVRDRTRNDWIAKGAGYWKHRTDIVDGLDYQDKVRNSRDPLS